MTLKRVVIALAKSMIVFIVAAMIFSSLVVSFPKYVENIAEDIFTYASPEAQAKVMNKLTDTCAVLSRGKAVTYKEICSNKSTMDSMVENCKRYNDMKKSGIKIENEDAMISNCAKLDSGEVQKACDNLKNDEASALDLEKISALCQDYREKKIGDKQFFFKVIATSLGTQNTEIPGVFDFNKYLWLLNIFRNFLIALPVATVLIILIYLLSEKLNDFISVLGEIMMSLSVLILLPYFVVLLYDKMIGFETTPFLSMIFGFGSLTFKAVLSVLLLLIMRNYTIPIIVTGFLLLGASIGIRVHLKRNKANS